VPERLPQLTLALLLLVAGSILAGGVWLARRQETIRIIPDRAAARNFAGNVAEQTVRLERLYENHLRQIAGAIDLRDLAASRHASARIMGICQVSILRGDGAREADEHIIVMKPRAGANWIEPTLRERRTGRPRAQTWLPAMELLNNGLEHAGWIDEPGQPLFFWQRRDWENVVIVFLLDRAEIADAIDGWFNAWIASGTAKTFAGVSTGGGAHRFLGARDRVLANAGALVDPVSEPDFLLPVRGRFGTWQLASFDPREIRQMHDLPTIIGACALAFFIVSIACAVFVQQRRAAALASQRVSFVNRVSHELRTPMTNMLLNIDLALEANDQATPETKRRLGLVQEETRRLARLIDNVLTFSRHERGKLRTETRACVPAAVIDAVVEQFAASLERRGLELRVVGALHETCELDADALAQILANLLSNAEKYVPGGVIEVASALDDGVLQIIVSDNGPGIPRDAAERIFRPFERLGSRLNEGSTGTGLGLSIARDLARAMGGTLQLRPSVRGAAFELCVPAPPVAALGVIADGGPARSINA
jgi:signal transduction histidine kinase